MLDSFSNVPTKSRIALWKVYFHFVPWRVVGRSKWESWKSYDPLHISGILGAFWRQNEVRCSDGENYVRSFSHLRFVFLWLSSMCQAAVRRHKTSPERVSCRSLNSINLQGGRELVVLEIFFEKANEFLEKFSDFLEDLWESSKSFLEIFG